MEKVVKKSPVPFYLVGALWLVWGGFFSLHRVSEYLLCAGLSLVVYLVGGLLFPGESYTVPAGEAAGKKEEAKPTSTGDPKLDELISEKDKAISEMKRLNESIKGEKISAQIEHLEEMTGKIISYVVAHPEKQGEIRKFMSYYLPTTLKLLNAYDRMDSTGVEGTNIGSTKEKIDAMMDTIVVAFDKQMDALFGDEALDISTDITVMEQMLAREGLGGQNLTAEG